LRVSHIDEDKIELPPLVVVGKGPSAEYRFPDEREDIDTATQSELTSTTTEPEAEEESEVESKPEPEPTPITSDTDTTAKSDNWLQTLVVAVLAFLFGWAINR
jgi:hypothetical protein